MAGEWSDKFVQAEEGIHVDYDAALDEQLALIRMGKPVEDAIRDLTIERVALDEWMSDPIPETELRTMLEKDDNPLHKAADAHVPSMQVAVNYAFARGRQAIRSGGDENLAAKQVHDTLLEHLPSELLKTLESGGNASFAELESSLRTAGDYPGHPFHGNQHTKYGRDEYGPAAVSKEEAHRLGYTEGPYYHSSNYIKTIHKTGFLSRKEEFLNSPGTMEEIRYWDTKNPVMFAKEAKDVIESDQQDSYGTHYTELYAKPGTVFSAAGKTLLGGYYVKHPSHVIPIAGTIKPARKLRAAGDLPGHEFHGNQWTTKSGKVLVDRTGTHRPVTPEDFERLKKLGVPPAWRDVVIAIDPETDIQAVGVDAKMEFQYKYTAKHTAESKAEKFSRLADFTEALPAVRDAITRDKDSSDEAAVLDVIDKTGFRIGSNRDTKAEKKAFGASTLKSNHVKVNGDKVTFSFPSKSGQRTTKTVVDAGLARDMERRLAATPVRQQIFNTNDNEVRGYLKTVSGEDFLVKDFRTYHGTAKALETIKKMRVPKTEKALKKAKMTVAKVVARHLGNTPSVALSSYISPEVFAPWQLKH